MDHSLIEKAVRIAVFAHKNQMRKVERVPYITHPIMVALKLAQHGFSDVVIAAALVHDVLEDTSYPESKLVKALGYEVVQIVKGVTKNKTLPLEKRDRSYIDAVKNAPQSTKAVSVADKIHNLETLLVAHAQRGPKIWAKFHNGKQAKLLFDKQLLTMFKKTWRHPLIHEYERLIAKERKLK